MEWLDIKTIPILCAISFSIAACCTRKWPYKWSDLFTRFLIIWLNGSSSQCIMCDSHQRAYGRGDNLTFLICCWETGNVFFTWRIGEICEVSRACQLTLEPVLKVRFQWKSVKTQDKWGKMKHNLVLPVIRQQHCKAWLVGWWGGKWGREERGSWRFLKELGLSWFCPWRQLHNFRDPNISTAGFFCGCYASIDRKLLHWGENIMDKFTQREKLKLLIYLWWFITRWLQNG